VDRRQGFPGTSASAGNAFADYRLGAASSSQTGLPAVSDVKSDWNLEFYLQDSWQATSRLTVYYGVRYMYQTPWTFRDNLRTTLDLQNNRLVLPQDSGTPTLPPYAASAALFAAYPFETTQSIVLSKQYIDPDANNWAPSVGLAYRLSQGKLGITVVRAGYGVYYNLIPASRGPAIEAGNPPGTPQSAFLPDITFQNPFPSA
jgi:hypothetical protein